MTHPALISCHAADAAITDALSAMRQISAAVLATGHAHPWNLDDSIYALEHEARARVIYWRQWLETQ